jgi:hypothetical protein
MNCPLKGWGATQVIPPIAISRDGDCMSGWSSVPDDEFSFVANMRLLESSSQNSNGMSQLQTQRASARQGYLAGM